MDTDNNNYSRKLIKREESGYSWYAFGKISDDRISRKRANGLYKSLSEKVKPPSLEDSDGY